MQVLEKDEELRGPPDGGRWISRPDAARRAGVHYNTLIQWQEQGLFAADEVKSVKQGKDRILWFYDISALDKIVATRHPASRLSEGETKERLAALEAENSELRAYLAYERERNRAWESERRELLDRILKLAERG